MDGKKLLLNLRLSKMTYMICLICRALHMQRRGARQLIQNFGRLLALPGLWAAPSIDCIINTAGTYSHIEMRWTKMLGCLANQGCKVNWTYILRISIPWIEGCMWKSISSHSHTTMNYYIDIYTYLVVNLYAVQVLLILLNTTNNFYFQECQK